MCQKCTRHTIQFLKTTRIYKIKGKIATDIERKDPAVIEYMSERIQKTDLTIPSQLSPSFQNSEVKNVLMLKLMIADNAESSQIGHSKRSGKLT